ncbi:MAG TPA: TetR family transcriptional regulator [Pseudonocardiaceae bacterium]|nr:TetR family transcriptional regulator [Pseudonocardiaceae bacterium]
MPVTDVERSPAAAARRAQIITATIEVIADEGFAQASFARIAQHAGLSSTRLISYHFAGKDELIAAVVQHVFEQIGTYMTERVSDATDAWDRLRAYIEGNVEFIDTHRAPMRALMAIVLAGGLPRGAADDHTAESYLETILRQGQAEGTFRDFDPRVLAMTVQRAVEGLPFLLAAEPDFDTAAYARELVTLFERGTRA